MARAVDPGATTQGAQRPASPWSSLPRGEGGFEPARGEDVWLFDAAGNRYLDARYGSAHVGHHNVQVTQAIDRLPRGAKARAAYLRELTASCERRLLATVASSMDRVYFCPTAREANAFALRLAVRSTRAVGVILNSDRLAATLQSTLAGHPLGTGGPRPTWARIVGPAFESRDSPQSSAHMPRFLRRVRAAVRELQNSGLGVAAIFLDPMLVDNPTPGPAAQMITDAVSEVRQAGGVYIVDESQGGLGRTGQHFWAHQRHTPSPDLITVGEALANGLPTAAVIAAAHLRAPIRLRPSKHRSPLEQLTTLAAVEATLEVLTKERLRESAGRVGAYLRYRLAELVASPSLVGAVRGEGLYQWLEIPGAGPSEAPQGHAGWIVNQMQRRRVLVAHVESPQPHITFQPPMTFTLEHVDLLMNAMTEVLRSRPPDPTPQ